MREPFAEGYYFLFYPVERPSRQSKHIFRPLTRKDLTKDVLKRELYILWPDNGQWYAAEIITVSLTLSSQYAQAWLLPSERLSHLVPCQS